VSHGAAEPYAFELGTDGPSAILVGVDDSVTSLRAASYAAGLARRQRARIIAVYIAPMPYAGSVSAGAGAVAAQEQAHDEIAASLRERAAEWSKELGISITFIAARGDAFHEIKRIADEARVDAIVVGASAKAGHKLVGSLAVRLVRAGKWPVTVVPLFPGGINANPPRPPCPLGFPPYRQARRRGPRNPRGSLAARPDRSKLRSLPLASPRGHPPHEAVR
jgi:nucleotide-binding universal stress UspA family protein